MGTSKTGTGPGSGVPLIPPWVPDAIPPAPGDGDDGGDAPDQQAQPTPPAPAPQSVPTAQPGRFGPARTSIASYAGSGSGGSMRRGLGNYVRKGLGGSRAATRRMGRTVITAGALFDTLTNAASGQAGTSASPLDPGLLAGRSADEIMDAVVEAVRPIDGTLDAEGERRSVRNALAALLERFPNADLLTLTEDQRLYAIENYAALDVFSQISLVLEKTIKAKAPSIAAAMTRLKEVKDYVRSTVSAKMRDLRTAGEQLGARRVSEMVRQALQETFEVFEEYAT